MKKIKAPKDKYYTHCEITACMIVKNEEDNIRRCLSSIQWCDHIVIVDTGSTDKTVEIIKAEYPKVELHHMEWEGNYFSKCRNYALSKVKTNWILIIDADEEWFFEGSTVESTKAELLTLPVNRIGAVKIALDDMVQGKLAASFKPTRFFNQKSALKYKSEVHNEPIFHGSVAVCSGLKLRHTGYDVPFERAKQKVEQTAGLLKKRLEADPKDYEAMFYLAQIYSAYVTYSRLEKTMEWSEVYFDHLPEMDPGYVRRNLFYSAAETARRLKDFDAVERWIKEGKVRFPNDLDLNYTILLFGIETQNPLYVIEGAQSYIKRFREMEADPLVQSVGFVFTKKPLNLLNAFHKLGLMRMQEGIKCLEGMDQLLVQAPTELKFNILGALKQELKMLGCESLTNRIQSNKVVPNLP